ncbi:helix-turn-helix transcriptional regulator [Adlercreutzia sp. ZJ242]|uniref:helix-turn-helix transcriptional regulator n=1 Tax=Adlercreutzia sp. ZJ242 TaxID=2709409 RepID=UPI0013EDCB79|nr:helix-turn-helix transcriptional regulator [Adlercreutzia sp. ZJ242]
MEGTKNVRLREARRAAGLSQAQLAAAVGVTRQTVCLIESGSYNPTLNLCVCICKTLDKTLDELFWEE